MIDFDNFSKSDVGIENESFKYLKHANIWFEDISKTRNLKIKALKAYASEMRQWPHPRSLKGINSLMQVRGATAGFNFAEAFVLGRLKN